MGEKVIRDPVHNYIAIDTSRDRVILKLLGTPEVQRLRRIHQLGVSQFTYPGAAHCRLSHSLGVYHLARSAAEYVQAVLSKGLPEEMRLAVLCAALLHDIGHAPYSHVLEEFFGGDHEVWTGRLIEGHTKVNDVLSEVAGLPQLVKGLIEGSLPEYQWLSSLLAGQLDVDRIDFLLRDAHFTGVEYGHFDYVRLLHSFQLLEIRGLTQPVWQNKAIYAIEEFLFARYWMYRSVYYHHTTRGFEQILKAILKRAKHDIAAGGDLPCLPSMLRCLQGGTIGLDDFLRVDDAVVVAHIVEWRNSDDSVLADLCRRFCVRDKLSHLSPKRDGNLLEVAQAVASAKAFLQSKGKDPEYYLFADRAKASVYDYYHPEEETGELTPLTSIFVHNERREPKEISREVPHIKSVTGTEEITHRYYFPKEYADELRPVLGV